MAAIAISQMAAISEMVWAGIHKLWIVVWSINNIRTNFINNFI